MLCANCIHVWVPWCSFFCQCLWMQYLELREFEYDVRAFVDFFTVSTFTLLSHVAWDGFYSLTAQFNHGQNLEITCEWLWVSVIVISTHGFVFDIHWWIIFFFYCRMSHQINLQLQGFWCTLDPQTDWRISTTWDQLLSRTWLGELYNLVYMWHWRRGVSSIFQ